MKERILLKDTVPVEIYNLGGRQPYMTVNIFTTIIEREHKFLFWKWKSYDIKQVIPYIENPFYDGEYSSNRKLKTLARERYEIAKLKLIELKNEQDETENI
jgi:hypothetical protein